MKAYRSDITVEEFVRKHGRPYDEASDNYFREPFASDTKVGKNSAIYNAHAYHTKVPPEGIVPYILHYTDPGDLVLDPFCGSGMTGVAAMIAARPPGSIQIPAGARLGARKAILNDLSPAACHIAWNYNHPIDPRALRAEFDRIMKELQPTFDWLYGTTCDRCGRPATIQYTIWSDVFECFRCGGEIVLWTGVVDERSKEVRSTFPCPACGVEGKKTSHRLVGSAPVITKYECTRGCRPRTGSHPTTEEEKARIEQVEKAPIESWYPENAFENDREMWRGGHRDAGIATVADFFTRRNLMALASVWAKSSPQLRFAITATMRLASKLAKVGLEYYLKGGGGAVNAGLTTTMYLPSFSAEQNVQRLLSLRTKKLHAWPYSVGNCAVAKGSAARLDNLPTHSVDYIFTDPPFGSNIFYADCSFLWESWLQDLTDVRDEAVWNKSRKDEDGGKSLKRYGEIMAAAFAEMHRVLKPGRWASVVFSNSDDGVWQIIREGAKTAGFELANTVALDKKQRSFKQVKGEKGEENVVGTDIIMNLHKKARLLVQVQELTDRDSTVLEILRTHLAQLPDRIKADSRTYSDSLRTTDALYSVAVQALMERRVSNRGVTMPYVDDLCATTFKKVQGRWYLPSEEIRYSAGLALEVVDEPSAIEWLRQQLTTRAMTFPEIVPGWRRATLKVGSALEKDLHQLLEENFWHEPATNRWRVPTSDERAQMADERTLRLRRRLRLVLGGKADPLPGDREILELMVFAYDHARYQDVSALYGRLDPQGLDDGERKKARRLLQVAVSHVEEERDVEESDG